MPTSSSAFGFLAVWGFSWEAEEGDTQKQRRFPKKDDTTALSSPPTQLLHDFLVAALTTEPFWGTGFDSLFGGGERKKKTFIYSPSAPAPRLCIGDSS